MFQVFCKRVSRPADESCGSRCCCGVLEIWHWRSKHPSKSGTCVQRCLLMESMIVVIEFRGGVVQHIVTVVMDVTHYSTVSKERDIRECCECYVREGRSWVLWMLWMLCRRGTFVSAMQCYVGSLGGTYCCSSRWSEGMLRANSREANCSRVLTISIICDVTRVLQGCYKGVKTVL
jgi:hypothetical protein